MGSQRNGIGLSLIWLVLVGILPIVAFSGGMVWLLADRLKAASQAELAGTSRALQVAVDRLLLDNLGILATLTTDVSLDTDDIAAFQQRAQRVIEINPPWRSISLLDPHSHAFVASTAQLVSPAPRTSAPDVADKVVATRQPQVVGVIASGMVIGEPLILIMAPVIRGGEVRFVATAALKPTALNDIFVQQGLPPNWTGAVLDSRLRLAGRSRNPEQFVGRTAPPSLAAHVGAAERGVFEAIDQDGDKAETVFSRSPLTGWSVVIDIPAAEVDGPIMRIGSVVATAGAALVTLALVLAGIVGRAIVARRQAHECAIEERENHYRRLFTEANAVMMLLDPDDGAIVDANAAASEFYGYGIARLKGMRITDITLMNAEEIARVIAAVHDNGNTNFTSRHRLAGGEIRDVDVNVAPLDVAGRSLLLPIVHDVTDRTRAEGLLAREAARYQYLLKTASDGIHVMDVDGALIEASDSFWRMLGYGPDRRPSLNVADWDTMIAPGQLQDRVRALTAAPLIFDTRHRRADGSLFDVEVSCHGVELDGLRYLYASARDITERKRLEQRLRQSEERFRSLVESTTDWVWETDSEHRFSWLSASADEVIGLPAAAYFGRRRWDLAADGPDVDAALWRAHREDIDARRSFRDFRYWIRTGDGKAKWITTSGSPQFDEDGDFLGYRGSGSDITSKAAAALRLKMLSTVVEQSPVSVVITDTGGTIEYVNSHFTVASGYQADEAIGHNARLLASGETPPEVYRDMWTTIKTGRRWAGELRNRRKNGELYWEMVVIAPVLNDHGGVTHYVAIKEDVSERHSLQERLRQTNAELEQFAYVASHDLRQPLRMVSSYLTLIERRLGPRLEGDIKEFLGFAVDGAKRMDSLILGLLEYSRTGRGAETVPVPLAEAVADALVNLTVAIGESEAEIVVADGLPIVTGDATELTRLFQNLIGNAVKYRAPERRPRVEIGWRRQGHEWLVSVADNGIGIAPDDHERAFAIFQRMVPPGSCEGAGIGLAVCRKILDHHGGRIWIESRLGEGSTFLMAFPAKEP